VFQKFTSFKPPDSCGSVSCCVDKPRLKKNIWVLKSEINKKSKFSKKREIQIYKNQKVTKRSDGHTSSSANVADRAQARSARSGRPQPAAGEAHNAH